MTVTDAGETDKAKFGTGAAVIVKLREVVRVKPPPVPVIVREVVPTAALVVVESVKVEVPLPGAAMEDGEKLAVTPAGVETLNAIALLKPPATEAVTVADPLLP